MRKIAWFYITGSCVVAVMWTLENSLLQNYHIQNEATKITFDLLSTAIAVFSVWKFSAFSNKWLELSMLASLVISFIFGYVLYLIARLFIPITLEAAFYGGVVFGIGGEMIGMLTYFHIVYPNMRKFTNFLIPLNGLFTGYNASACALIKTLYGNVFLTDIAIYLSRLDDKAKGVTSYKTFIWIIGGGAGFLLTEIIRRISTTYTVEVKK